MTRDVRCVSFVRGMLSGGDPLLLDGTADPACFPLTSRSPSGSTDQQVEKHGIFKRFA